MAPLSQSPPFSPPRIASESRSLASLGFRTRCNALWSRSISVVVEIWPRHRFSVKQRPRGRARSSTQKGDTRRRACVRAAKGSLALCLGLHVGSKKKVNLPRHASWATSRSRQPSRMPRMPRRRRATAQRTRAAQARRRSAAPGERQWCAVRVRDKSLGKVLLLPLRQTAAVLRAEVRRARGARPRRGVPTSRSPGRAHQRRRSRSLQPLLRNITSRNARHVSRTTTHSASSADASPPGGPPGRDCELAQHLPEEASRELFCRDFRAPAANFGPIWTNIGRSLDTKLPEICAQITPKMPTVFIFGQGVFFARCSTFSSDKNTFAAT